MYSIASEFLKAEAEAGPLRDLLFNAAGDPAAGISSGPVSDRVALSYFRKSLPHAAAIAASSEVSPEVLARFAKDTRVSVRRPLILNPSTPTHALLELLKWACERGSSESSEFFSQARRLDAAQLVDLSVFVKEKALVSFSLSPSDTMAVAAKIVADAEAFEKMEVSSFRSLGEAMAILALSGSAKGLTLKKVVDRVCQPREGESESRTLSRRDALVRDLIGSCSILNHELLDMWDGSVAPPERSYLRVRLRPAALVEEGVRERLVAGEGAYLELALVNRVSDRLIRGRIPNLGIGDVALVANCLGSGRLSAASERALASRLLELVTDESFSDAGLASPDRDKISFAAKALITNSDSQLPEGMLLQLLRLGGMPPTSMWLSSQPFKATMLDSEVVDRSCVQPVSAKVLSALVDDPGLALDRSNVGYMFRSRSAGWPGLSDELLTVASHSAEHGGAVARALADRLSGFTLYRAAAALYPYIRSRLGEDVARWESFIDLSKDWQGSLDELLDTTGLLVGG